MTVRLLEANDVPQLIEMAKAFSSESPRYRDMIVSPDKLIRMFALALNRPDHTLCLVAESGGEIVGSLYAVLTDYYFTDDFLAEDRWIYVKPEFRGKLIAESLKRHYLAWAKDRGAKEALLGVSSGIHQERTEHWLEASSFDRIAGMFSYQFR